MYKNCHISASTAPRHLKIDKDIAYTMIYHKMNLFLSRSNYVGNNMVEIVTKRYDEICHKIYRSALLLKMDSVDIIFQHRLRLCSLYFLNKKVL